MTTRDSLDDLRGKLQRVRADRDFLDSLLDLSTSDDLEELLERALEQIVSFTEADQGLLQLYADGPLADGPEFVRAYNCTTHEMNDIQSQISQGIVQKALAGGHTIISKSAMDDERFQNSDSVREHRIGAALCAPVGKSAPIGVVYLQRRETPGAFAPLHQERAERFAAYLHACADRLLAHRQLAELTDHTADIRRRFSSPDLIGRSRRFARLLRDAASVAQVAGINILLTGPSGTGKSELARVIHQNSGRDPRAFVEINAASIPQTLVASELFGVVAGAHSTAERDAPGKLSQAHGGTLFLDEIADLHPTAQAAILRFLDSGTYRPVGGTRERAIDVRVISATNKDLEACIREGTFRGDLYYRLSHRVIEVPGLDERREDIPLLVEHFARVFCERNQWEPIGVSRDVVYAFQDATWNGQVRELSTRLASALANARFDESPTVELGHLPEDSAPARERPTFREAQRAWKCEYIRQALERHDWNVSQAADELGLRRTYLHEVIRDCKLSRPA